jgi:hypothetical protein
MKVLAKISLNFKAPNMMIRAALQSMAYHTIIQRKNITNSNTNNISVNTANNDLKLKSCLKQTKNSNQSFATLFNATLDKLCTTTRVQLNLNNVYHFYEVEEEIEKEMTQDNEDHEEQNNRMVVD